MDNLKYTVGFKKVVTREEFDLAFDKVSKRNDWSHAPIVSDILLSRALENSTEHLTMMEYFLQTEKPNTIIKDIKLQDYINFIRLERNKKFNVNFKVKARKFISSSYHMNNFKLKRSTSLNDYIVNYVIKDYIN